VRFVFKKNRKMPEIWSYSEELLMMNNLGDIEYGLVR
jgi:hypothetical protein